MEFKHNISILGSTGSIGTQTLDIVRAYPGIKVWAISAHTNIDLLEGQTREFMPELVCVVDEEKAKEFKVRIKDLPVKVTSGKSGLSEVATYEKVSVVVTAVVGISGLIPTIDAIKAGKNIALANKETLVTGGHIVTKLAKEHNVALLPVDSEHSAIFQSLQGKKNKIKKILLTASGGPFFGKTREQLKNITPADALKHPNWDMGAKVTIDSAVMYEDNAVIAQLGTPDMELPIQYALSYPDRLPMSGNELDLTKYAELTFAKPDTDTFYALELAKKAGREGGILPTVFNSSDEAAVELFLKNKISYLDISYSIEKAMDSFKNIENPSIEDIFEADRRAREIVYDRS